MATTTPQKQPADPRMSASPKRRRVDDDEERIEKKQEDETVTCNVPRAFNLMLDHGATVRYEIGAAQMPRSHAEHWYAQAHGVEIKG